MKKSRVRFIALACMLITSLGLLSACSNNGKSSEKNKELTVSQVLEKTKKIQPKSYQLKAESNIKVGDEGALDTKIDGKIKAEPFLMHVNTSISGVGIEQWVDQENMYIKADSDWYKTKNENFDSSSLKDLQKNAKNNKNIFTTSDKLVKNMKMKKSSNNYVITLKANPKDKKTIKKLAVEILQLASNSQEKQSLYEDFLDKCDLKKVELEEIVDQKTFKVKSLKVNIRLVAKSINDMEMTIKENITNIDKYNDLKLPSEVKNAKKLPQEVIDRMNSDTESTESE